MQLHRLKNPYSPATSHTIFTPPNERQSSRALHLRRNDHIYCTSQPISTKSIASTPIYPSTKLTHITPRNNSTMYTPTTLISKWSTVSAQGAVLLFLFVGIAVVGLCTSAALRKKRDQMQHIDDQLTSNRDGMLLEQSHVFSWMAVIKKAFVGSLRCWSDESRLSTESAKNEDVEKKKAAETAELADGGRSDGRRGSATMVSPLWKKKILMGGRCELPKFSGLILYDENGLPLHGGNSRKNTFHHQERRAAVVTTLKDLL